MPKLHKDELPQVKLDTAAAYVEVALTREQRRGLFEVPGRTVVAIVELTSKSYTGHADGEEKEPQVKLRITGCEVARSDDEAAALLEAKRAMYRKRRIDGTLDEVGPGGLDPETVLSGLAGAYPSERDFEEHRERERQGTRR